MENASVSESYISGCALRRNSACEFASKELESLALAKVNKLRWVRIHSLRMRTVGRLRGKDDFPDRIPEFSPQHPWEHLPHHLLHVAAEAPAASTSFYRENEVLERSASVEKFRKTHRHMGLLGFESYHHLLGRAPDILLLHCVPSTEAKRTSGSSLPFKHSSALAGVPL